MLLPIEDEGLKQNGISIFQNNVAGPYLHNEDVYNPLFNSSLQVVGLLKWMFSIGNIIIVAQNWAQVYEEIGGVGPNVIAHRMSYSFIL